MHQQEAIKIICDSPRIEAGEKIIGKKLLVIVCAEQEEQKVALSASTLQRIHALRSLVTPVEERVVVDNKNQNSRVRVELQSAGLAWSRGNRWEVLSSRISSNIPNE